MEAPGDRLNANREEFPTKNRSGAEIGKSSDEGDFGDFRRSAFSGVNRVLIGVQEDNSCPYDPGKPPDRGRLRQIESIRARSGAAGDLGGNSGNCRFAISDVNRHVSGSLKDNLKISNPVEVPDRSRIEVAEKLRSGENGGVPSSKGVAELDISVAHQEIRKNQMDKGKLPIAISRNKEANSSKMDDAHQGPVLSRISSGYMKDFFQKYQQQFRGESSSNEKEQAQGVTGYDKDFPSLPRKVQFVIPGKQAVESIPFQLSDSQVHPVDNSNVSKENERIENPWNRKMSFAMATREKFVPPKFPGIPFRPPEVVNGKQVVRFTGEEISKAAAPLKWCLVGKFSKGRPPLMEILNGMKKAINFKEEFFPAALDQRHVFIRFQCREDFIRAYVKEVWWFGGQRMRIFRWTPGFAPGLESSIVPVWVGLNGIRPHMLDHGIIQSLVAPIGTYLCSHPNVQQFSRLSYAQELEEKKKWKSMKWKGRHMEL